MSESLRSGHRYRVSLDADAFETMLRERREVTFYEGAPRRGNTQDPFYLESAWRVEDTFTLTLPPMSQLTTVDPPALIIRYEDTHTVHVHAQLTLGTWQDELSQRGGELVRQGALRTGFVGAGLGVGLLTLVAGLVMATLATLGAGFFGPTAAAITAVTSFVMVCLTSVYVFARTAASPIVDHVELAWAQTLPRLTEMSGELLTPHILGSADAVQALPYRAPSSEESHA